MNDIERQKFIRNLNSAAHQMKVKKAECLVIRLHRQRTAGCKNNLVITVSPGSRASLVDDALKPKGGVTWETLTQDWFNEKLLPILRDKGWRLLIKNPTEYKDYLEYLFALH